MSIKISEGLADIIKVGGVVLAQNFQHPGNRKGVAEGIGRVADALKKGIAFEDMEPKIVRRRLAKRRTR